ncbi:MAG: hypothetical protein ACR2OO_11105 [Thermomicrobiales bacterium]
MTEPRHPPPSHRAPRARRRGGCLGRVFGALVATVAAVSAMAALALGLALGVATARTPGLPLSTAIDAAYSVLAETVADRPSFAPERLPAPVPICRDVPPASRRPLGDGLALMRGTTEGRRLYDELVANQVCIRVDDLRVAAGYTNAVEYPAGSWTRSRIVIDRAYARTSQREVLAAILVHEATHLDRAISGTACWNTRCTLLANGVRLEEEIAAHRAEATWWTQAFGKSGRRFADGANRGENRLAAALVQGEQPFIAYVTAFRSDPREAGTP